MAKRPVRLLEVTSSAFTKLLQHRSTAATKEAPKNGPEPWFYTFARERRHFEKLTARLHRPSGKDQQGSPRAQTLSPRLLDISRRHLESELQRVNRERDSLEEADPGVRHILDTSQQLISARLEQVKQEQSSSPRSQARKRVSLDDDAFRLPPALLAVQRSPRKSRLRVGGSKESSSHHSAPLPVGVSGLENPRLWRDVRERMQKVLLSGDMPGGMPACERVQQRLADSIRDDLQKGYLVPASVARRARSSFNVLQAVWSEKRRQKDGRTSLSPRASSNVPGSANATSSQESGGGATQSKQVRMLVASFADPAEEMEDQLLSLQLLPSIGMMSVEHKHALLDDLEQVMRRQGNRRFKSAVLGLQRASRLLRSATSIKEPLSPPGT